MPFCACFGSSKTDVVRECPSERVLSSSDRSYSFERTRTLICRACLFQAAAFSTLLAKSFSNLLIDGSFSKSRPFPSSQSWDDDGCLSFPSGPSLQVLKPTMTGHPTSTCLHREQLCSSGTGCARKKLFELAEKAVSLRVVRTVRPRDVEGKYGPVRGIGRRPSSHSREKHVEVVVAIEGGYESFMKTLESTYMILPSQTAKSALLPLLLGSQPR